MLEYELQPLDSVYGCCLKPTVTIEEEASPSSPSRPGPHHRRASLRPNSMGDETDFNGYSSSWPRRRATPQPGRPGGRARNKATGPGERSGCSRSGERLQPWAARCGCKRGAARGRLQGGAVTLFVEVKLRPPGGCSPCGCRGAAAAAAAAAAPFWQCIPVVTRGP